MTQVVILCGGLGTRLGKLSEDIPKALLKINGTEFLGHQIDAFKKQGFKKFHFCLGHLGRKIENYLESAQKGIIEYSISYDAKGCYGTLHALEMAIPYIEQTCIITYGDTYLPINYQNVLKIFYRTSETFLMTIYKNEGRFDESNVWIKEGCLAAYKQNYPQKCSFIDYGLFVADKNFLKSNTKNSSGQNLSTLLIKLSEVGIKYYLVDEPFYEIGNPVSLKRTEIFFGRKSK